MPVSYTHLDVYKRQMYNKVAQLVRAGEDAVKVMINNGNYSFSAAVNGLTQIMNDVPYICLLYTSRCV